MMAAPKTKIPWLIIGVGNEYRHDDGAGLFIARRLRERGRTDVAVHEQGGEGARIMELWKGVPSVILIDAVRASAAGTIFRFDAHAQPVPAQFFNYSTHAFSVAEAVELARALKQLPSRVVIYGIAGKNFAAGIGLSCEVEKAAQQVIESIMQEIVLNNVASEE